MEQKHWEGENSPPSFSAPKNQAAPARIPFSASRPEVRAALVSYPLAYFYYDRAFAGPFWMALFTLLFCCAVEIFCRAMGRHTAPRESWFWLGCMGLVTASLWLYGGPGTLWAGATVSGWDLLFLHGLAVYWVLCRTGMLAEGGTGPLVCLDLWNGALRLPFSGFFLRARTLWQRAQAARAGKALPAVLLGLLVTCPLFLYACRTLAAIDEHFGQLIQGLLTFEFSWRWGHFFFTLLVSLPVGCYLYGLAAGALRRKTGPVSGAAVRAAAERARVAPPTAVGTVLFAFCALYLLFFGVQSGYLFGAFAGRLPAGFTAAEYARQGFFELCKILLLNLGLLAAASKVCRTPLRQNRALQTLGILLCVCCELFAVVAGAKMGLYIARFGLTPRRVLASWAILVLAAWGGLAIATLVRPFRAVRWAVWAAAGAFALLCIAGPDELIVRGNFALYRQGVSQALDSGVLRQCGARRDLGRLAARLMDCGWFLGRTIDEVEMMLGAPSSASPGIAQWALGTGKAPLTVRYSPADGTLTQASFT